MKNKNILVEVDFRTDNEDVINNTIEYMSLDIDETALVEYEVITNKGRLSDGYHTFNELYYHRMILFSVICNQHKDKSWKSWQHHDGTMFDDYFIVGVTTVEGDYTYHYHKDNWDQFNVQELEFAPEWDGHKPEDITRLLSLI